MALPLSRRAIGSVFDIAPHFPCIRDLSGQRAHVLAHEPRVGPRGDKVTSPPRRICAGGAFSSARSIRSRAPRIAAVQLPDDPALHVPALVPGRRRGVHGDLDGRRPGPRAGRLRRDGVPRDGARRRPLLRSVGTRLAWGPGRFPDRTPTPISTARDSSRISPTRIRPRRSSTWLKRDEGSERYYADQFQRRCSEFRSNKAWQEWIAFEREFQQRNLAEVRQVSDHAAPHAGRKCVGSISRMYLRRGERHHLCRISLSGRQSSTLAR